MILHRMTASFGCLNQETLEFQDGLNILYAPNESGKSTWCAFLLAMLYGLNTRAREKKGIPPEKNRYRPWSGAAMEGLLECSFQGKRILLRRSSENGISMGNFSAVYANTGDHVPGLTGDNVGEQLTGVGRDVFERSLLIRQTNLAVDQTAELEQRIAALVSSGDEQISWSLADARLREWQRARKYNKTGQLIELEKEALHLQERLSQLSELWQERLLLENSILELETILLEQNIKDMEEETNQKELLQLRWADAKAELEAAQRTLQSLEVQTEELSHENQIKSEIAQLERAMRRRGKGLLLFSFCGLIISFFLILSFLFPSQSPVVPLPAAAITIAALGLCVVFGNLVRIRSDKRSAAEIERLQSEMKQHQEVSTHRTLIWESTLSQERAAKQLLSIISHQLNQSSCHSSKATELEAGLNESRQHLARLSGRLQELGDPIQLEAELEENRSLQRIVQEEYDAISEAISALSDAEQELRARFSPELNHRTGIYFAELTGGAYEKVMLERDFSAKAEKAESLFPRSALLLSQGTGDQLYFALRLAICDLILPKDTHAPLILDDAFTSFDDQRVLLALELLREVSQKRQVLLFSCHSREAKLMNHVGGVFVQSLKKSENSDSILPLLPLA